MALAFSTDRQHGAAPGLKLLELEKAVLAELEHEHEVVFVSNSGASDVVLCTRTETFKVTKVESSNSTLLADGNLCGGEPGVIRSVVGFHWEASRMNPRLDLRSSLPIYSINDSSVYEQAPAPDLVQLQASMQASPTEIEEALKSSTVLVNEFGGHTLLHETNLYQCLDQVLVTISLRGWSPSSIPLRACAEDAAKRGSDYTLATYCLKYFSLSQSSSGKISLDVRRVARALAKSLFVAKSAYASTAELIADLRDCLPAQIEPAISWLDGVVSVSKTGEVSLIT